MQRRALISVSDKEGIVEFAKKLRKLGYEIISTGGTAKVLKKAKIPVTDVSEVTDFPECFGGRVKTMHPKVMGGILFRRKSADDKKQAKKLEITPIDVVCVNLYPFERTMKSGASEEELIEQIDIGGPTLLRSAAKNFTSVTVVCDPTDYDRVLASLKTGGKKSLEIRRALAAKVFAHTAQYDVTIATSFGLFRGLMLSDGKELRYGENPHQSGEYFSLLDTKQSWRQLGGKELSYLNILDSDAAWRMVSEFKEPTAVMVKHANPSGIASSTSIEEAFQKAYDTDRLSAFGVIIALNRECSSEIAQKVIDQKIFVEVIIAPSFSKSALKIMSERPNVRLIEMPKLVHSDALLLRSVPAFGGVLVQNDDLKEITEKDVKCVTQRKPTKEELRDLLFAWKVVKHAKSNAIVFAKDACTIGIGSGQTSRVDATWIAAKRSGSKAHGAVMASDAFFPFPDSIEEAAKHGIAAIIQPGGSIRDEEVFKRADELGLVMVLTGTRAFRH